MYLHVVVPKTEKDAIKLGCCKYPFVAAIIYVRIRISKILGTCIFELGGKPLIFLKYTSASNILSGNAFTVCGVCTL
jgi:hypothetical protein